MVSEREDMPIHIADPYKSTSFAQRQTGLLFNLPKPPEGHVQLPAGISLCMIVKNEETFLASCLESLKDFVDEINIVDTGSTDGTLEIARRYTDRIEHREWRNDFAWARNESLAMATKRWVITLDADEELTPESGPMLVALGSVPAYLEPVYLRIANLVNDQSGAGTMSHLLPRIFPNTTQIRYQGVIHENIALVGSREPLVGVLSPIGIIHKGYTAAIIAGRNKAERNLPLLARAIEENAEDSFSWFNYGVSSIAAEEIDRGIEAFEKMFAIDNVSGTVKSYHALAYLTLAGAYANFRDDVEKAIEVVDKCLDIYPDYTNAFFAKGDILTSARRYDEAREAFVRSIETRTAAARHFMVDDEIFQWKAQYSIAITYLKTDEPDKAADWFKKALENKPDSFLIRRQLARALEKAQHLYDADIAFRDLFEDRVLGEDAVVVDYVDFLIRRGRNSRALEVIDESLLTIHPDFVLPLQLGAAMIAHQTKSGDPLKYLESARLKRPANSSIVQLLETIYKERNDTTALDALYAAELAGMPETPADFARRSHRLLELHRYDEARTAASTGLELARHDGFLLYNAALADVHLGDRPAARKKLESITSDTPTVYPTALFLRAQLGQDDFETAITALDELERQQPNNVDGILLRADVLEKNDRAADAERVLRQALKPGEQRIGIALATFLMRGGRNAEAAEVADLTLSGA